MILEQIEHSATLDFAPLYQEAFQLVPLTSSYILDHNYSRILDEEGRPILD